MLVWEKYLRILCSGDRIYMHIGGLQKFSLIDYPGKIAAVVFTQGCNFRCPYCHNPELVLPELFHHRVPESLFFRFLDVRCGQLDAVVISGGEPTMQNDLVDFIKAIKERGFLVKLDTNGSNPSKLKEVLDQNIIDYIAMDIKAPFERYSELAGCDVSRECIENSIRLIESSGIEYDFRTTYETRLLSLKDVDAIQEYIKPEHYHLQECLLRNDKPHLAACLESVPACG
jgi:pyruvate formate lyase activating enzyme